MTVALFLALLVGALAFGAWVATRLYAADASDCRILADFDRAMAVDDAADMAIDGDDWDRDSWWSA